MLYEANKNIKVRIKTPSRLTKEETMSKIVMQGDTWVSTMASVQCDSFGKGLLEEEVFFCINIKACRYTRTN